MFTIPPSNLGIENCKFQEKLHVEYIFYITDSDSFQAHMTWTYLWNLLQIFFFFLLLFSYLITNFGPFLRGQLHQPDINHCVLTLSTQNLLGTSQRGWVGNPVEHLFRFEPGTFWFYSQRLNQLSHSPHIVTCCVYQRKASINLVLSVIKILTVKHCIYSMRSNFRNVSKIVIMNFFRYVEKSFYCFRCKISLDFMHFRYWYLDIFRVSS